MSREKGKKINWTVVGLALLIAALVVGVKMIFVGLEHMAPQQGAVQEQLLNSQGETSGYTLSPQLPEGEDVEQWLSTAQAGTAERAYWLARQDSGEFLLYLPAQDRAITARDITATEEKDGDGQIALVLRIRTPEGSQAVDPAQQLLCLQTSSQRWNGTRVRVVLDGRELEMSRQLSMDGALYTQEETGTP